jgi:menaquinol-cytochrome c reductase iron-sulfur subunit
LSRLFTSRRRFLSWCTNALTSFISLLVMVPALPYLLAPLWNQRRKNGAGFDFQDLGALSEIPVGQWQSLPLQLIRHDGWEETAIRQLVWVRRGNGGDADVKVFSPVCPHLGCLVDWRAEQSQFICPCHRGAFDDADGKPRTGPAPRGLDPLEFEVRSGHLWVRWQDFKFGAPHRIPTNA